MSISSRIHDTIESWQEEWRDRLRGWMASWVSFGIETIMDITGRGLGIRLDEIIDQVATEQDIPPEITAKVKDLWKGEGEWQALLGGAAGGTAVGSLIGSTLGPFLMLLQYTIQRIAKQYRLDPFAIVTAWRRDPEKYAGYFDDLKDQGWDEDRIEALKFFTLYYPAPADLIRWQAREVFEPEMIERYGLDSEFAAIDKEPFYKAGMTDEQILNFWRAHWEHASWMQIVEMLHRGLIDESEVYDWFRVVEIPPHWRNLLIDTAYTWPTRVDVRRWWDMRTIDETELRRLYSGMGYRGVNLDNYMLWTKVYVAFPDLLARWTNGWITEDDVRSELTGLGMPADRVEEMIQTKIKAVESGQAEEGKALTKTEIYKGVKNGKITRDQAIELLMDLNYSRATAELLLETNVAVLEGSPETFAEFKDLTILYRRATGKEVKPMPEEVKQAAEELIKLNDEVEALKLAVKEEERNVIPTEGVPEAATAKLDELRVALHRAEAELARVQTDYDIKVAEWKHGR